MKRYHGNEQVGPGIYFNARELAFRSVEDEGKLPGGEQEVWREVPALVMLIAGPVLGLVYVMFLPLIGFVMLGGLAAGWVGRQMLPALRAASRVLQPAWEPALAFLGRGREQRQAEEAPAAEPDEWADQVRDAVAAPPPEGDDEEQQS